MRQVKTREQVRKQFNRVGMSIAEWSRRHGVDQRLTYQVLSGEKKGLRGQSHRIAVLLGIKDGIA
jgi:gp16 family phage-associated protein